MAATGVSERWTGRRGASVRPLRVALVAPPWIPVPAPGYGGTEAVVELLAEELVHRGHEIVLFAAPGSSSRAEVRCPLPDAHPDEIGLARYEADYVARVFADVDEAARGGQPFDVIHDHSGHTAVAMADRVSTPLVHTIHGALDADGRAFYAEHGHKAAALIAISAAQAAGAYGCAALATVVPNPVAVERWPLQRDKGDYVLWIGRMAPVKGAHRAIAAARAAGTPLVLAGPIQDLDHQDHYFDRSVRPRLDADVRYVGEVTGTARTDLYARARALLMPIRWAEPFGLVMVEAMACGTPVIAFCEGAAREIVINGVNGWLVEDEEQMAEMIRRAGEIDPVACRESVSGRYAAPLCARRYEAVYRSVLWPAATTAMAAAAAAAAAARS
jgi:glycosyltransferase involved in cell wall biosynthesis